MRLLPSSSLLSPLLPPLLPSLLLGAAAAPLRAAPQDATQRPFVAELHLGTPAPPAEPLPGSRPFHPGDWAAALANARVPGVVLAHRDGDAGTGLGDDAIAALAAACRNRGLAFAVAPPCEHAATADAPHEALVEAWFAAANRAEPLHVAIAPDADGRLREQDLAALRDLAEHLRLLFAEDAAEGCHRARHARCGEAWFAGERTIDVVELGEDPAAAGAVVAFRVDTWDGERWQPVQRGGAIGARCLVRFAPRTVRGVRWWIERARGEPRIATFAVRREPVLVVPPVIRRDPAGTVAIEPAGKPVHLHYTLDGAVPDRRSPRYLEPFALPRGGTVRAVALPADESARWLAPRTGPVATAVFGMATQGFTVLEPTEGSSPGASAALAFDGDPRTHWQPAPGDGTAAAPPQLAIDLGTTATVTGFAYLPRQDGDGASSDGDVAEYAFDVRGATGDWRRVASGTFDGRGRDPRVVMLPEPARDVRAVRFVAVHDIAGRPSVACAELAVLVPGG